MSFLYIELALTVHPDISTLVPLQLNILLAPNQPVEPVICALEADINILLPSQTIL